MVFINYFLELFFKKKLFLICEVFYKKIVFFYYS